MRQMNQPSQLQQGGGIIIQRYSVIKPTVTDSSIYDSLPDSCKAVVDAITAKATGDITDNDLSVLAAMIQVGTHC